MAPVAVKVYPSVKWSLWASSAHPKRSSCCGVDVMPDPARQMLCPACHLTFDRNTNAANNMANCL